MDSTVSSQPRSSRAVVRNPVLGLTSFQRLASMPLEVRTALADVLAELARDARSRAQASWTANKGPMAVYWKAVGAYAGHVSRALRRGTRTTRRRS